MEQEKIEKKKNKNILLIAGVVVLCFLAFGLGLSRGLTSEDDKSDDKTDEKVGEKTVDGDSSNENVQIENTADENGAYTYICLSKDLSKDSLISQADIKECKSNTKLGDNALTQASMKWFNISINAEYGDNDEKYYLMDSKHADNILYVEDIYWELELVSDEKTFKDPGGNDYKLAISSDGELHITDDKNNVDKVLFGDDELKLFAPNQHKADSSLRPILLTKAGNVYVYSEDNMSIWSSSVGDVKFEKANVTNIVSFVSTNVGSSNCLACHNTYAVDQNGEKHLIADN